MKDLEHRVLLDFKIYSDEEMVERMTEPEFSSKALPVGLLAKPILTDDRAQFGAHKQSRLLYIRTSPTIKSEIRNATEDEEYENYHGRMSNRWLKEIKFLGMDYIKKFLEDARSISVLFKRLLDKNRVGAKKNKHCLNQSAGRAKDFIYADIQQVRLMKMAHIPGPMNFLARVLERPSTERAFLLIPVAHPKERERVPYLRRKILEDIRENYR